MICHFINDLQNVLFKKHYVWPGTMTHTCSPPVLDADVGRPQGQDLPKLHDNAPFKIEEQASCLKKKKLYKFHYVPMLAI